MNSTKRDLINNIAVKIRNILNITTDNFDIKTLVEELDGNLVFNDFSINEAIITKSSSDSPNAFEIMVNNNYNSQRIRFSIAHELGHLFLHMQYLINPDEWNNIEPGTSHARNTNIPYSRYEAEANEFAAAFLMPKDRFLEVAEENFYNLNKIASIFNVSIESAKIRGKVLGIWE